MLQYVTLNCCDCLVRANSVAMCCVKMFVIIQGVLGLLTKLYPESKIILLSSSISPSKVNTKFFFFFFFLGGGGGRSKFSFGGGVKSTTSTIC